MCSMVVTLMVDVVMVAVVDKGRSSSFLCARKKEYPCEDQDQNLKTEFLKMIERLVNFDCFQGLMLIMSCGS